MRIQSRTLSPDSQLSALGSQLPLKVGPFRREGRSHLLSSISNLRVNALRAFTLIEFIGVLAVLTILAALTVPSVIRQIDEAAWTKERTDLAGISNSLVLNILSTKTIPDETAMAQAVATWTRHPLNKITTNPRRNARAFVIDGSVWPSAISLPWTQTSAGVSGQTAGARVMVVSSTGRALPINSGSLSTGEFESIWNAAERVKPSTWTSWTGRGEDLVIQRINLEPLFHHLVLVNRDPPGVAHYAIDSTTPNVLAAGTRRAFYLNGTDVGLYSGTATPTPQLRALLEEDQSFLFQGGRWAGDLDSGDGYSDVVANEFAALAGKFLATQWYPNAHQGGNQQGAVISMFNFMLAFQLWADKCPVHFPKYGLADTLVPEYVLMLDIAGGGESSLLNDFTGAGGLLK